MRSEYKPKFPLVYFTILWKTKAIGSKPTTMDIAGNLAASLPIGVLTLTVIGHIPTQVGPGFPTNHTVGPPIIMAVGPNFVDAAGSGSPVTSGVQHGLAGVPTMTTSVGHLSPPGLPFKLVFQLDAMWITITTAVRRITGLLPAITSARPHFARLLSIVRKM